MIPDANALMGKEITLGKKLVGVFDGTLLKKCAEKIQHLMVHEKKSMMSATASTMKYSLILTGVGMVGGAVLGWMRGGRIENWKDIIAHPWQSTKLVLGLEEPKAQATQADAKITIEETHSEASPSFAARVEKPAASHAEAAAKPALAGGIHI
jgi:hypothetical protein